MAADVARLLRHIGTQTTNPLYGSPLRWPPHADKDGLLAQKSIINKKTPNYPDGQARPSELWGFFNIYFPFIVQTIFRALVHDLGHHSAWAGMEKWARFFLGLWFGLSGSGKWAIWSDLSGPLEALLLYPPSIYDPKDNQKAVQVSCPVVVKRGRTMKIRRTAFAGKFNAHVTDLYKI